MPPANPLNPENLSILYFPDPALRRRAVPVPEITGEVRAVAQRLIDLMHAAEGIGLAAPQVGLPWRLFVVDVPPTDSRSADPDGDTPPSATRGPRVYINPKLSHPIGPPEPYNEGCLSLPDITGEVLRPPTITITALGPDGREFTEVATGLLARCLQHETDHLDGVLIIDKMTQMSRLKNRAAVRELQRGART